MRTKLLPLLLLFFILTSSAAYAQTWDWSLNAKGNNQFSNASHRIATDHEGNSFIVGYYTKTFQLGDYTLVNPSDHYSKIYLAKVSPAGQVLWLQDVEAGETYDEGIGIALDDAGNCYITGTLHAHIFVAKYTTAGEKVWVNDFDKKYYGYGKGLALDQADHVYVVAEAQNYLGGVFLAKLDNSGNTIWVKHYESECHTNGVSGDDIAVDALGNSYITGIFACDTLAFDDIKVAKDGGWIDRAFLAKISPEGNTVWAQKIPDLQNLAPQIALTETNELIVAGVASYCCSTPTPLLFKFTAEGGDAVWMVEGHTYKGEPKDIATDYEGAIYLGGTSFGNYGGTEEDFHVEKYTANGEFSWNREIKTKDGEYLYGMSIDNKGNAYVVGRSGIDGAGITESYNMNQVYTIFVARLQTGATTHLRPYKPQVETLYTLCKGETIPALEAVGENITWYSAPASGTKIHTGSTFTPAITSTDTFYVSQTINNRQSWRKPVVVFISELDDFTVEQKNDTLFAPASDAYTYEWFHSDTLLTGSTFSYYVPDTTGIYKVVVSDRYCTKESSINLTTLAIDDEWQTSPIRLTAYPNPSPGAVTIHVELPRPADLQVHIYNTTGLKVYSFTDGGKEAFTKEVDIRHLPRGLYILEAISQSDRRTIRFVKN